MYISNPVPPVINDKNINNNKTVKTPIESGSLHDASTFLFALKTYAASMFAPVTGSNQSNRTNFKKLKDKTGKKEEKTRTVYDVIGAIAAIERKMGQEKK